MAFFENQHYQVAIHADGRQFEIRSARSSLPGIAGNCIYINGYDVRGRSFGFSPVLIGEPQKGRKDHALGQLYSYLGCDEKSKLCWKVDFALPEEGSLIFWRVELTNLSKIAVFIQKISLLQSANPDVKNLAFPKWDEATDLAFYANGWQSWSLTGSYADKTRRHQSRLGILQKPIVNNAGTPIFNTRGKFSGDFFGVVGDRTHRNGLLLGFLSQKNHFGSLTTDLRSDPKLKMWANGDEARLDPQTSIETDWAVLYAFQLDDPDPLAPYLQAVAQEHAIKDLPAAMAGWCSWYYYYEDISPQIINMNLEKLAQYKDKLPLDLVQIDDGFEAQVGDWLEFRPEFVDGVAGFAKEIKREGFMPGLWLAPFILHPNSRTAVEKPSWLLRQKNHNPVRTGFVWNTLGVALDLTVPEALEYACKVVDVAAHQWAYPYLKLDFLYAAALKGVYHDATQTRAQVLRHGMEAVRRTIGEDTLLLGCGAPLGSMLGLVDAMRIGADVSPTWEPKYFGISRPFKHEPHMPCVRNAIQNDLTRAMLNGIWWVNDPDCLLVRPDSELTLQEVHSLATVIGMTGGSIILSDNMQTLPAERMEIAASLLPPIKERVRILDWMDAEIPARLRLDMHGATGDWFVLAYFNWQDDAATVRPQMSDFDIPDQDYWVRSFWDNRVWRAAQGDALAAVDLPAHAPLLMAVRPAEANKPAYLGSSLHISQGLEIRKWKEGRKTILVELNPGRIASGMVDIYHPEELKAATFEGKTIPMEMVAEGCYRCEIEVPKQGKLEIKY